MLKSTELFRPTSVPESPVFPVQRPYEPPAQTASVPELMFGIAPLPEGGVAGTVMVRF